MFRFVLAGLATWRLAYLVAREDGPGQLFRRARDRLRNSLGTRLLDCVKCVGIWISIPFAFFVVHTTIEWFVTWLALAGFTALIDELTRTPFAWSEAEAEAKHDDLLQRTTTGNAEAQAPDSPPVSGRPAS